jgi:16S rRNA (guanine527-N7)-methyltransferase
MQRDMVDQPTLNSPPAARLRWAGDALGLALDDVAIERLLHYSQLLQRWNKVYNLTALRGTDEILSHHLIDCLAVLPALRRHAAEQGEAALRLLDVGSGGGLPGAVLAIIEPGWQVVCVDAVGKKASFIRQVAAELRLPNLQGLHARVESLAPAAARYDVITSRAFASLADFTAVSMALLAEGGVWMAMKGKRPEAEQAELPPTVQLFHVEQLQVPGLDAQRCLVWLRHQAT